MHEIREILRLGQDGGGSHHMLDLVMRQPGEGGGEHQKMGVSESIMDLFHAHPCQL